MFILIIFILSVVFGALIIKYGLSEGVTQQVRNELFNEKDLPIKGEIKLTKKYSIKLYGLKYEDEENQVYDKTDLTYLKLVNIITDQEKEYIKFDFANSNVESVDFASDEHKLVYMDLIELVTNFNLAQFVFKGKKDGNRFKLLDLDNDIIDRMKQHTDEVIAEIFPHIVERMIEEGDSPLLKQAFDKAFNQ